ncbi:hypothetical protein PAXINDRAFT_84205 [Paxillus involutus ATCC 200175]|uniref:Protein kinase domain-containing protein n=1 Tax=Paxillus involutus ATCC 200175 TaxID=664439 RepID=A0A0C9T7K9_PAXIN|nr:hypothetical protein PAXINDRAFT_84205 [Paxillus involutus ATCC 200175]
MEASDIQEVTEVICREVSVWVTLSHENILPLYGITSDFGNLPALVSPWMENGSLKDYSLKPGLPDDSASKLAMVSPLSILHDKGIVHGNLVNTNVLIDNSGEPRITDFGLSVVLKEQDDATFNTSFVGNVRWTAPELLDSVPMVGECQENAPISKPTKASDIYSFGCIMAYVFEGKIPYHYVKRDAQIIMDISQGINPRRPMEPAIDDRDWELIQRCWRHEPHSRPSDEDVITFVGAYPRSP